MMKKRSGICTDELNNYPETDASELVSQNETKICQSL